MHLESKVHLNPIEALSNEVCVWIKFIGLSLYETYTLFFFLVLSVVYCYISDSFLKISYTQLSFKKPARNPNWQIIMQEAK